jgi:ectoine hydroxylase-related dioxygenase (phytanoyl-CoA dioxygenase family)
VKNSGLSTEQVESFRNNGYLFPLPVFSPPQIDMICAEFAQARRDAERLDIASDWERLTRANAHYLMPFVYQVATAPQLLDRVESILGHDLLLWSAEFFIKPAGTDKIVSWHQDLTYWGLGETDDEITAWVALSDVSVESGCMRFLPGSQQQRLLPHRDTFDASNLLSRGQQVDVEVNENEAVDVILRPGEVSLHHGRMFHASGPNRSDHDRVGLVFRFLTPSVKQLVSQRDYAMQVRGIDEHGHWIHVAPPTRNFGAADIELYERIREDQRQALAAGAAQELNTDYQAP